MTNPDDEKTMPESMVYFTQVAIKSAIATLGLVDVPTLEKLIEDSRRSLEQAHSIGSIIHPAQYFKAREDGSLEDAEHQLKIAEAVLALIKVAQRRDEVMAKFRGWNF